MSDLVEYQSEGYLTIEQVHRLLEAGRRTFLNWKETWASETHQLYFPPRRELISFSNLLPNLPVTEFMIEGQLLLDENWANHLKIACSTGYSPISSLGSITAQCFYNEIASQQSSDCGDNVGLLIEKTQHYGFYRANGSNASTDVVYRKRVIRDLIDALDLPLSITENENHYLLKNMEGGSLWISQAGLRKKNPSGFRCEILHFNLDAFFSGMVKFLSLYSSKLFSCSWQLRFPSGTTEEHRVLISHSIHEDVFPAHTYEIRLTTWLTSINSLAGFRSVLADGETAFVSLGSFVAFDNQYELSMVVSQEGYKLSISSECSNADSVSAISSAFGVKFEAFQ